MVVNKVQKMTPLSIFLCDFFPIKRFTKSKTLIFRLKSKISTDPETQTIPKTDKFIELVVTNNQCFGAAACQLIKELYKCCI